jgi:hypothetical protein
VPFYPDWVLSKRLLISCHAAEFVIVSGIHLRLSYSPLHVFICSVYSFHSLRISVSSFCLFNSRFLNSARTFSGKNVQCCKRYLISQGTTGCLSRNNVYFLQRYDKSWRLEISKEKRRDERRRQERSSLFIPKSTIHNLNYLLEYIAFILSCRLQFFKTVSFVHFSEGICTMYLTEIRTESPVLFVLYFLSHSS